MKIPIKRNIENQPDTKQVDEVDQAIEIALQSLGEGDGFDKPDGVKVNAIRRIAEKLGIRIQIRKGLVFRPKPPKLNHLYEDTLKPAIWDMANNNGETRCYKCGATHGLTQSHRTNRRKIAKDDYMEWAMVAPICLNPCHISIEKMPPGIRYELMTEYINEFISDLSMEGIDYKAEIKKIAEKEL